VSLEWLHDRCREEEAREQQREEQGMETTKKKPTHRAYVIESYEKDGEQKAFWTDIGVGWTNKDGSLTVDLKAFPIGGRLVLQEAKERVDNAGAQAPRSDKL